MLRILPTVCVVSTALSGCGDLRMRSDLEQQPIAVASQPSAQVQEVTYDLEDPASFYREYTPWKKSGQRASRIVAAGVKVPALRGTISPEITGSNPLPEVFPEDPEELSTWLQQRRERANQIHLAHMAWFDELEKEAAQAIRSICHGC